MSDSSGKAQHLVTGEYGENMAADFMRKKDMKILERNWRPPSGLTRGGSSLELDIIARGRRLPGLR